MIQQILFILISLVGFYFAFKNFSKIRRNILLGKEKEISGDTERRWKNVILVAFGQKKMFKKFIPAILHFFIYAAFVITQIELIEIFIDGFTGNHRIFASALGGFYTFIISFIEVLTFLAFFATIVFLWRRNMLKVPRLVMSEMNGWPKLDANLILVGELILIAGITMMNGADTVLQGIDPEHYPSTGNLAVSSWLGPALFGGLGEGSLQFVERFGWWMHFLTVLAFLNYLPFSKHLHVMLAFPNVYYADENRGEMDNMPEIMNEVKSMMGLIEETAPMTEDLPEFGAKDIFDLSWKNIMDSYTCTECGRCTDACPANQTGKKLSPRKIMMDVRDRTEEIGKQLDNGVSREDFSDDKSLFDFISEEELMACTTCNACVEECPVMIDPLDIIMQLRRYKILTEAGGPSEWLPMFTSIENSGSVWQVPDERDAWKTELNKITE